MGQLIELNWNYCVRVYTGTTEIIIEVTPTLTCLVPAHSFCFTHAWLSGALAVYIYSSTLTL